MNGFPTSYEFTDEQGEKGVYVGIVQPPDNPLDHEEIELRIQMLYRLEPGEEGLVTIKGWAMCRSLVTILTVLLQQTHESMEVTQSKLGSMGLLGSFATLQDGDVIPDPGGYL